MRTRLIAAALTTALRPACSCVGAGAPAQAGDLNVKLSNTPEGLVHVEWDAAKGPGNTYVVQIATDRLIKTHVRVQRPRRPDRFDVPHASLVTPASGDYTFVKVQIDRHGNGKNSGTPTAWIKPTPVVPPATGGKVEIATFNTRIWNAEDKKGNKKTPTSWSVRRKKIAKVVRATDPGVLLLQESSGAAKRRISGKLWQFQDLAKRLPKKYKLSVNGLYTTPRKAVGSQGSRIIVDTSKFQVLSTGYIKPPAFSPAQVRWVPWALLRDRVSAEEFYVASAHLQSGADKACSTRLYGMRQRQTDYINGQLSSSRPPVVASTSAATSTRPATPSPTTTCTARWSRTAGTTGSRPRRSPVTSSRPRTTSSSRSSPVRSVATT